MDLYLYHIQYLMVSSLSPHGQPSILLSGELKRSGSLWDTEAELYTLIQSPKELRNCFI